MPGRSRQSVAGTPEAASPEAARAAALRLLKARDRTPRDLARRLRDKGYEHGTVDAVIARLESVGLLDERATAERLVRAELRKAPASARLLRAKLFAAGVPDDTASRVIADALAEIDAAEQAETLARAWLARRPGLDADTAARRLAARLARRGFDGETVRGVMGRVLRLD
jgi:regulatory protein